MNIQVNDRVKVQRYSATKNRYFGKVRKATVTLIQGKHIVVQYADNDQSVFVSRREIKEVYKS